MNKKIAIFTICPITQEAIAANNGYTTSCHHTFDKNAFIDFLVINGRKSQCPCCRQDLKKELHHFTQYPSLALCRDTKAFFRQRTTDITQDIITDKDYVFKPFFNETAIQKKVDETQIMFKEYIQDCVQTGEKNRLLNKNKETFITKVVDTIFTDSIWPGFKLFLKNNLETILTNTFTLYEPTLYIAWRFDLNKTVDAIIDILIKHNAYQDCQEHYHATLKPRIVAVIEEGFASIQ